MKIMLSSLRELAGLFQYASLRLTDMLQRRTLLEFIRAQCATLRGDDARAWYAFGALGIKDFHIDVASFMDSLAPVILQACGLFDAEGKVKLPGFSDIQSGGSPRSTQFRSGLPLTVLGCIDATDRWWPDVKVVRDTLAHREHQKIAFGSPNDGVLFQVYAPAFSPIVVHPAFLWPTGHNVADFRRYSAYVLAEALLLLDAVGCALTEHLGFSQAGLTQSFRAGDFGDLVGALGDMLQDPSLS